MALPPGIPEIEVRRSQRRQRTVSARLTQGRLVVYLPAAMSASEEAMWVAKMAHRFEARRVGTALNSQGRLESRARELNRRYFEAKLKWSSLTYVTNQRSRFGSCSPREGKIRISAELAGMPAFVLDYVLMHELAHLLQPNHSAAFWELVNRYPLTERARGYLMAKGMQAEGDD